MDRTMIEKRLKFHTERLDNLYAAYNALVNSRAKSYRLDDRELTRFDRDTLSDEIEDAGRKVGELTALLNGQSAATRIGIVAPVEFTHVIHADFSQMRMSAGPQAVKIIFDLCPPEKTSLQPAIDLTRAFMQAHRLKPVCEGYTRQYAWFVDPDGQMRHYSELIVPVTAE